MIMNGILLVCTHHLYNLYLYTWLLIFIYLYIYFLIFDYNSTSQTIHIFFDTKINGNYNDPYVFRFSVNMYLSNITTSCSCNPILSIMSSIVNPLALCYKEIIVGLCRLTHHLRNCSLSDIVDFNDGFHILDLRNKATDMTRFETDTGLRLALWKMAVCEGHAVRKCSNFELLIQTELLVDMHSKMKVSTITLACHFENFDKHVFDAKYYHCSSSFCCFSFNPSLFNAPF